MSKNVFTKREDLICGKIDLAQEIALTYQDVNLLELLSHIREDAEKMERKLISRKKEQELFKQKMLFFGEWIFDQFNLNKDIPVSKLLEEYLIINKGF